MPSLNALLSFGVVAFGLVILPGPNTIYILNAAISANRRGGFAALAGVLTAFVLLSLAVAFGLEWLVRSTPGIYSMLRWVGGVYLFYVAWRIWRGSLGKVAGEKVQSIGEIFAVGFAANLLNPQALMLYLALLPQFVDESRGFIAQQTVLLAGVHLSISATISSAMILAATAIRSSILAHPTAINFQRTLFALAMAGLAAQLLLTGWAEAGWS